MQMMMRRLYCGGTTGRSVSNAEASEVRAATAPAVSGWTELILIKIFILKWELCLSSSVVVVRVAAAGSGFLPARSSAEVLRDTTIRESDAGQRHRHLPHRHGTPHQLSQFSHQGAVNTQFSHLWDSFYRRNSDNETKLRQISQRLFWTDTDVILVTGFWVFGATRWLSAVLTDHWTIRPLLRGRIPISNKITKNILKP